MTGNSEASRPGSASDLPRRELLAYSAAFGTSLLAGRRLARGEATTQAESPVVRPQSVDMKKSINLWAFPYPQKWTLHQ